MDQHAIIMADSDGTIQHWSSGAVRLLGYSVDEAVGQKLDLVVPEIYRDQHWDGFRKAITSGVTAGAGEFFDAPVLCRTGEEKLFRGQLHLLRSENRGVIGAMAIFSERA
jgi:PAS domain S-box-containing protein